jgi:hypothetical protein
MGYIQEDYHREHPRFLTALFGTFFKMFGWISLRRPFNKKLLKKTLHDDRVPTDAKLDGDIELLRFYMEHVWPLINYIAKEKTIYFFRYKLKRFLFKIFLLCLIVGLTIGIYKIYNLYIQKPKIVLVESKREVKNGLVINKDIIFIPAERATLTKDNLDYFASEMGIKYWYYVRKQIIIESGFSSDLLIDGNNLFGMRLPGQRETTAIGEIHGHAKFKHWVYSLYDYKLWQDLKMKSIPIKKGENYPQWLARIGYAESEEYSKKFDSTDWYVFKSDKY